MIFQRKDSQQFWDVNGVPQSVRILTDDECRQRAFLPPLPKTAEQEIYATLSCQANAQLDELIWIRGKDSIEAKVGKRILAERKAKAEREEADAAAEKAASGLDGTSIPKSFGQGSNMSTSPVFGENARAEVKRK